MTDTDEAVERAARADCPFCKIVDGNAPAEFVARGENDVIIVPLNPVVPGHVIVIPHQHVTDVTDDPMVSGAVFRAAAWFTKDRGPKSFNLITSVGAAATQTVRHLHVHIVPRSAGDGLTLPWTAAADGGEVERLTCPHCGLVLNEAAALPLHADKEGEHG